ncbi:hypothetical protein KAR91_43815 [Candidatus Pacearchaeota archaeon]|nr:hypothetical protein [Candidatus Pacearchaeota archaeon]
MAKIVSMSSGAIDPITQSKRVFFRPSTSGDIIRVGDCVCYNHDINTDHKERSSDPTHLGLTQDTYADGAQDRTGRLFIVEQPGEGNLEFFAGIVKALGLKAGADGDMIEIFVPNGAVVPVMVDQACTKNVTIVGIRGGYYEGTYPGVYSSTYTSRPIGIAMETQDGSSTDALCWVKVDPTLFTRQGDYSYRLIIDDEAGSDVTLNQIYVQSNQTAGEFCLLRVDGILNGAGDMGGGLLKIRARMNAVATKGIYGATIGLTLAGSAPLAPSGNTHYSNAALHLAVGTSGTPDLSTQGGQDTLCALSIGYYADESGGAPPHAYAFHFNSGATYQWQGLMRVMMNGHIGDEANSSTPTWATAHRRIPIMIGGNTYYIHASAD